MWWKSNFCYISPLVQIFSIRIVKHANRNTNEWNFLCSCVVFLQPFFRIRLNVNLKQIVKKDTPLKKTLSPLCFHKAVSKILLWQYEWWCAFYFSLWITRDLTLPYLVNFESIYQKKSNIENIPVSSFRLNKSRIYTFVKISQIAVNDAYEYTRSHINICLLQIILERPVIIWPTFLFWIPSRIRFSIADGKPVFAVSMPLLKNRNSWYLFAKVWRLVSIWCRFRDDIYIRRVSELWKTCSWIFRYFRRSNTQCCACRL